MNTDKNQFPRLGVRVGEPLGFVAAGVLPAHCSSSSVFIRVHPWLPIGPLR